MSKTNVFFWGTDDRLVILDDVLAVDVQVFPETRDRLWSAFDPMGFRGGLDYVVRPREVVIRVMIPRVADRLPYALGMTAPLLIATGGGHLAVRRAFLEKYDVTLLARPRVDGEPWSAWDIVDRPTWTLTWRTVGDPGPTFLETLT